VIRRYLFILEKSAFTHSTRCRESQRFPFDVCKIFLWQRITLVSARAIKLLGLWQGFAVLVGLAVIMCSLFPLAVSADQDDNDSVPEFFIASMGGYWCESRRGGRDRAGTSRAPTLIVAVEALQPTRNYVDPGHVGDRTVLDISSSFRC